MSDDEPNAEATDWVAVYQASRYAIPVDGAWRVFSLDGDEPAYDDLDRSVTLITAWNPDSEERPDAWNRAANERLAEALREAGEDFDASWGASLPGVEPAWKEHGFAVFGWTREDAAQWGRAWGQRAVVWMDPETAELLFCAEEAAVQCGLRRFPDEPRTA